MRKLLVIALLAGLLAGCNADSLKQINLPVIRKNPPADPAGVFGPIDQQVAADLNGDGTDELVVLGPVRDGARTLGVLQNGKDGYNIIASTPLSPDTTSVQLLNMGGRKAIVTGYAKDGAPQYQAYRLAGSDLDTLDYYTLAAPAPTAAQGWQVTVNKHLNVLWLYNNGKLVKAYRVATGRQTGGPAPTWADYKTNFFTPEGSYAITMFARNPPYNALKPGDKSYPGGHSENPLGTRWMGFQVLDGDNAWVWGIHGTSEPDRIGTWASDGCIRMFTEDAEELFATIPEGTALQVVGK